LGFVKGRAAVVVVRWLPFDLPDSVDFDNVWCDGGRHGAWLGLPR